MKLYLIPNILTQEVETRQPVVSVVEPCLVSTNSIPVAVSQAIRPIRLFFVEEPKAARALLRRLDANFPLGECTFVPWNEHTKNSVEFKNGQDAGIISEAGYPCVADPGAELVRLAHAQAIEVVPLPGASSIILALAASGLNGQQFAFNGYLPKERQERLKKIKILEQRATQEGQTQIVMEAPYRSQNLLGDILSVCHPKTLLCVACDVTGHHQMIKTLPVDEWKKKGIVLDKIPTLFLMST